MTRLTLALLLAVLLSAAQPTPARACPCGLYHFVYMPFVAGGASIQEANK